MKLAEALALRAESNRRIEQLRWNRQRRSELAFISALPVADLRAQADAVARHIRELDIDIQRINWEVDLLDE